ILGVLATIVKSDLEIPASSAKFISLYLLFSIGFRGGQELIHSGINETIIITLVLALLFSIVVPLYVFYLLRWKLNVSDAGAVA
ncbi:sodium-dependent bicarbonate transport family permease, partial [Staphylococcus aureus]